jgi:hypothetical protein
VHDAIGVRIDETPITPEKVLKALESTPPRYGPSKLPAYPFPRLIKVPPPWVEADAAPA